MANTESAWNKPETLPHDEDPRMIIIRWKDNMGTDIAPAYWPDGMLPEGAETEDSVWIALRVAEETMVDERLITGWVELPKEA